MFRSDDASRSDHGLPATVRIDRQTLRMEIYPPRSPASAHQSFVLCSLRKSRCLNSTKYITKLTSQSTKLGDAFLIIYMNPLMFYSLTRALATETGEPVPCVSHHLPIPIKARARGLANDRCRQRRWSAWRVRTAALR